MPTQTLVRYLTFVFDSSRWEGFEYRDGDIVISTPPKSGTTWMQRICALLVFGTSELDRPLTSLSPWIDMLTLPRDEVLGHLASQTHRRFIKTHTPFDGIPYDERATYVCVGRDPRDVALSWDNHRANADWDALLAARDAAVGNDDIAEMLAAGPPPEPETPEERFWMFMEDQTPVEIAACSLRSVVHHLATFWERRDLPNVVMMHYEDMKTDLEGQMRRLAERLGIEIPAERWPELAKAATFAEMKRNAEKLAPAVTEKLWLDNSRFFHRGESGQWRDLFRDGDQERYETLMRELASPDLCAWMHHGSLGG